MDAWIECGAEFIEADVIRWAEGIWDKRRRKRAVRIGSREVVAEVLTRLDAQGWTSLLIRQCEATVEQAGSTGSHALKAGSTIKRKAPTLTRGRVERLRWSDESARAIVASRFMNERSEPLKEPPATPASHRRKR